MLSRELRPFYALLFALLALLYTPLRLKYVYHIVPTLFSVECGHSCN